MDTADTSAELAILGAGSWGTALAVQLARAGRRVALWARRPEAAALMQRTRHNPTYLPDIEIPEAVTVSADLQAVASASSHWAVATPSHAVRSLARDLRPYATGAQTVVALAKGIENDTLQTMSQVLAAELDGAVSPDRIGVLYGPSHAEEVATGCPTTVVAAAPVTATAERIQSLFMTDRLRVYINTDVVGVEIAGSVKNVLAIAAGISDGIGYGDNAKAALITRGVAEIRRLGLAMGAQPATFAGLAGIGDVVVTCTSRHSRNRHLGEELGRGKTLDEIEQSMDMIAEGVRTTRSVRDLAREYDVEMPITEAVHAILFGDMVPEEAVDALMTRAAKRENWQLDAIGEA
jgi:glycerol-3-phosphate dehydrogenase (NAD(P)+)